MKFIIGLFLLFNLTNTFATGYYEPTCEELSEWMLDARMEAKRNSGDLEAVSKYLDFSISITGMCIEEYNVHVNGMVSEFAPTQVSKDLTVEMQACGTNDILDGEAFNYMEVADCNFEVFRRAARILNIDL